jgi:hypothetical protein
MKGAGSEDEARRSKDRSEGAKRPSEDHSEPRESSDPGAFKKLSPTTHWSYLHPNTSTTSHEAIK